MSDTPDVTEEIQAQRDRIAGLRAQIQAEKDRIAAEAAVQSSQATLDKLSGEGDALQAQLDALQAEEAVPLRTVATAPVEDAPVEQLPTDESVDAPEPQKQNVAATTGARTSPVPPVGVPTPPPSASTSSQGDDA